MPPPKARVGAVAGLVLLLTGSVSFPLEEPLATSIQAVGVGLWESTRAAGDKRDWQIEIERFDDDSIAGSIIVIGSPYLHKARIEGRVDGSEVYGVLVADGDKQVGTFTGTIGDAGLSGTYTTDQGDSGNWTWAGPAAARSLKDEKTESAAAE